MTCRNPIETGVLVDYWLAALNEPDEHAVEEHLFTCDACGERLSHVIMLAGAIRELARQGSLLMVVSDTFLEQVATEGARVRQYAPPVGGSIACTVAADDDFLIGRLTADLTGARRVDLCFCDANGTERHRLADIPFNTDASGVAFQQSITYAKAASSETLMARLVAIEDAGERVLGEYTFNHTRTLPGPGA
jgi:hypothetical protein